MKIKFLSFALIFLAATLFTSFSTNMETEANKNGSTTIQNDWGPWKVTSCFRYLQYQVKKDDYAGKWFIRFKNGYNKSISMTVEVIGNIGTDDDSGRFTIQSGYTKSQYYFVDKRATSIQFSVEKVKFGDTSWGGPYAECDH